jgi:Fur family transcriptional regulator, ferric uptake regulator
MTGSPNKPPQVFADVEHAILWLRDSGLRLSTARRLVLEALFAADGPVSAGHLARTLSLEESSVYRNLELLEDRGVLRHLHLGHSPGLYVLAGKREVEYLYCERCAKVTAVPPDRLDAIREQITSQFGYTPRFTHFAIVGTCEGCTTAHAEPGRDDAAPSTPSRVRSGRDPVTTQGSGHEHLHSHGDYVHAHPGGAPHTH